jgi:hypothetical protein
LEEAALSVTMVVGIPYFEVLDLDAVTFNALVDVMVRVENARKTEMFGLVRCAVNGDKESAEALLKVWSNKKKAQAAKPTRGAAELLRDFKQFKLIK